MIALKVLDVRAFTSKLFVKEVFDNYLVKEVIITTYNTFTIDGHIKKEFYSAEELEELDMEDMSSWKDLRSVCFELIKGKKTPLNFKIVFALSKANTEKFLNSSNIAYELKDIEGLYINIVYDGTNINCITGTSLNMFTLDKSLEHEWDDMVKKYLKHHEIAFE